jgi:hypothetical protein
LSDFSNTVWGVLVGGAIVIAGQVISQVLEAYREGKKRKRDFLRESLVGLQDAVETLHLAVEDARDHLDDTQWQPARYRRNVMRVSAMSSRVSDAGVRKSVKRCLEAAEAASTGGPMGGFTESAGGVLNETSRALNGLLGRRWWWSRNRESGDRRGR